jgi:hypothetical protein
MGLRKEKNLAQSLTISAFALFVSGCTVEVSNNSRYGELTAAGRAEASYCSAASYSGNQVTITGQATYHARQLFEDANGNGGLGGLPGAVFPIRQAEVQVIAPNGSIAQCTSTDDAGRFSFLLPQGNGTYKVSVLSRSPQGSNVVKVSVLNRPAENSVYSISGTTTATQSHVMNTIDASADGQVLGGAFNIMDKILDTNNFLRKTAGNCSSQFTGCPDFIVAPKVNAYWMKGFDPSGYTGGRSPLSFYLPGYSRLFILGGLNGDTDSSDTDHFDNSIIIHEYGHFLEDNVFRSNSPGGSHTGDAIIDPRLAWSEGWGNFIQAAVQSSPHYRDTYGNADGMTGFFYNADLENPVSDYPNFVGEGNFREFSVTRFLWDTIDDTPAEARFGFTDDIHDRFIEIWAALNRRSEGFLDPKYAFLNVGEVHLSQEYARLNDPLAQGSDFVNIRGLERHRGDTTDYAQYVDPGTCADFVLTPASVPTDNGSFATSDLFSNNKFYYLKTTTPISGTLTLTYADAGGGLGESDADLYLYNEKARFGNSADWVALSNALPDGNIATPEKETVHLSNLPPGKYLINVYVDTGMGVKDAFTYTLKLNGATLCPAAL